MLKTAVCRLWPRQALHRHRPRSATRPHPGPTGAVPASYSRAPAGAACQSQRRSLNFARRADDGQRRAESAPRHHRPQHQQPRGAVPPPSAGSRLGSSIANCITPPTHPESPGSWYRWSYPRTSPPRTAHPPTLTPPSRSSPDSAACPSCPGSSAAIPSAAAAPRQHRAERLGIPDVHHILRDTREAHPLRRHRDP